MEWTSSLDFPREESHGRPDKRPAPGPGERCGCYTTIARRFTFPAAARPCSAAPRPRSGRAFAADLHALLAMVATNAPQAQVLLAAAPPLDAFPLLPSPLRQLLCLRARQLDAVLRHAAERHVQMRHVPIPLRPKRRTRRRRWLPPQRGRLRGVGGVAGGAGDTRAHDGRPTRHCLNRAFRH